ncbi:keratin, type I cytoskeletal 19-like [Mixophyes fleayi]|uniref:keratin, type I cytoskeletal 19-like n=1 Tax=Mixophyes fleayi TaxID=3061075 RepID=UPI003F4DAACA
MSVGQGFRAAKGLGSSGSSSVQTSNVRMSSGRQSSGGLFGGGGTAGSYAGSLRGGSMNVCTGRVAGTSVGSGSVFGGGHGFSGGSGIGGAACGFGGSGFGGSFGFGGSGFGGSGFGTGSGFESSTFQHGLGHGGGFGEDHGLLSLNEKLTMQNLNDRLAAYLDKVRSLENANADLEKKIHHWYETHGPRPTQDYSPYYKTIEDLQKKIYSASTANAQIVLQIDNARLAADDFKLKYENELHMRQTVEADINGLRKVLDDLTLTRSHLESQLESLKEELAALKKNHNEEMKTCGGQLQGTINVDVKAAPGIELQRELGNLRQKYEALIAKNQKELENWYHDQTAEMNQQMTKSTQEVKTTQSEVTELRRSIQSLEIDLQAQLSMKTAFEDTLAETEGRYCMQLSQIQGLIQKVESELADIRCEMENQSQEYKILLDIKSRLEQEISTYRSLLDGQDIQSHKGSNDQSSSSNYSSGSYSDRQGGAYHVRIRTEDSDGKVISTRNQSYYPGRK